MDTKKIFEKVPLFKDRPRWGPQGAQTPLTFRRKKILGPYHQNLIKLAQRYHNSQIEQIFGLNKKAYTI